MDKYNFAVEEFIKSLQTKALGMQNFNRMIALIQPGYSAEKDLGFTLVFFY